MLKKWLQALNAVRTIILEGWNPYEMEAAVKYLIIDARLTVESLKIIYYSVAIGILPHFDSTVSTAVIISSICGSLAINLLPFFSVKVTSRLCV